MKMEAGCGEELSMEALRSKSTGTGYSQGKVLKHFLLHLLSALFLCPGPVRASGEEVSVREILPLDEKWTGDFDGMV